jgi:hypothetical protein
MKEKIAVATVSGRAYYFLVNELKRKKLSFLSVKPTDPIPFDIKVVITTQKEQYQITHPKVVIYKDDSDPAEVVSEAARLVQGKECYEKIVVGVDPGKIFGIAVLGDGAVVETINGFGAEETFRIVSDLLKKTPARAYIVRVGDSAPTYSEDFLRLLDADLPENVAIEMVSETGTTRLSTELPNRKGARDVISAIRIAGRFGRPIKRGEKREQSR